MYILCLKIIIIIIIIMSLFKEDDIFSTKTNLTYGPLKSKTYLHGYIHMCFVRSIILATFFHKSAEREAWLHVEMKKKRMCHM